MMNKTQKALLKAAGYDLIEEVDFIKEIKCNDPNVYVFYDGSKFIMHVCHCDLLTAEEQEEFAKEWFGCFS